MSELESLQDVKARIAELELIIQGIQIYNTELKITEK
jgi:hypothetical protein